MLKLTICSVVTRKYTFIPHCKVTLIVILKHKSTHCGGPGPWLGSGCRPGAACPGSSGCPRQTPSHTRPCKHCLSTLSMSPQHQPGNNIPKIKKGTEKAFVLTSGLSVGTTRLLQSWISWPGCMSAQLKSYSLC